MSYVDIIREIRPSLSEREAVGVEASMRVQYSTLDHLSRWQIAEEIEIALACENEQPGYLESVARSFGMVTTLRETADQTRRSRRHPLTRG